MLQAAKEIEIKGFFIHSNTIPNPDDAFANDVNYHQSCWIYKQHEASKDERVFDENYNDTAKVKSDIEIINMVNSEIIYPTASTQDMKNVNNTYIKLLKDNNCTDIKTNYKPYLNQLIKDNISIAMEYYWNSILNEKPSILIRIPSILPENLGFDPNNRYFEILGFSHLEFGILGISSKISSISKTWSFE